MDNSNSYSSYPESGESSPRSRDVDFENPPPWEDQNYKVKLMCSYGGKILPRPHDNQLCYTGGETKILAVDRSIKLSSLLSRLSSLSDSSDVSFKYQLPGEDLDALISVTTDDDLDHMMHEYDRLYRASAKPARMRLFLFPPLINHTHSFGSDRSDRDRFVDALNSGPAPPPDPVPKPPLQNNPDFIPAWAKGAADVTSVPPPTAPPSVPVHVAPPPEFQVGSGLGDNRVAVSDPVEFQRQLQDLQRLQIGDQADHQYRRKSDDNFVVGGGGGGGYGAAGDYYNMQKVPEKLPPVKVPPQVTAPAGYWPPEKNLSSVGFPVTGALPEHLHQQQPMYMINAGGGGVYHAPPMVRPVTGPASQGYYPVQQQQQQQQRVASDVYRDQPVYGAIPQALQQTSNLLPPQVPKYAAAMSYAETTPYSQVAYDSVTGRQVYYPGQGGGVVQPQQQLQQAYSAVGPAAVSSEMRVAGGLSQEGKVVGSKIPQTSGF